MSKADHENFQKLIGDWAEGVIKPIALNERKVEELSDKQRKHFDSVFRRYVEIRETLENLELSFDFIKAPMPRKKGLKLDRYLNYHLTFYIQEIYILSERLESYAKVIMRIRKKSSADKKIESRYDDLVDFLRSSLHSIVKVRGSHVHSRPFTDESLDNLSHLSFISLFNPDFKDYAKNEYRITKAKWVKQLSKNKIEIDRIIDAYFAFMFKEFTSGQSDLLPNYAIKGTSV